MTIATSVECTPTVRGKNRGSWRVLIVAVCVALLTVLSLASPSEAQTDGTDTTPPGPVIDFTATAENEQVSLSWVNPTDGDYAGTKILRSTAGYATSPDQTEGQTFVYQGPSNSYKDYALPRGTYYYTAFTQDSASNWSVEATASVTLRTYTYFGWYTSKSGAAYKERVVLTTGLEGVDSTDKPVELWRLSDDGATWMKEGLATYGVPYAEAPDWKAYFFRTKPLTKNTTFQWRFAGDSEYEPAKSSKFRVGVKAYLSKPVTPTTVKKDRAFITYGYLKPYHSGYTRMDFYRYNERQHKWAFYKTVNAKNTKYNGYTKYTRRYKLPSAGDYYVKAYHKDASHVASWSPKKYFTVKR